MERLKQFTWLGVALTAVAVLIILAGEGRAVAQVLRAALVQNVDEPGRHPYSESVSCGGYGCTAQFSQVPPGKRLVVTFVNGYLGSTGAFALGGHGHETPRLFSGLAVNAPTLIYYDAGERPEVNGSGSSSVVMALSGYYVNLP